MVRVTQLIQMKEIIVKASFFKRLNLKSLVTGMVSSYHQGLLSYKKLTRVVIFNRPGVAVAVLQTALSFIN